MALPAPRAGRPSDAPERCATPASREAAGPKPAASATRGLIREQSERWQRTTAGWRRLGVPHIFEESGKMEVARSGEIG